GLLGLHSSYGPPGCSTAQGGLCHEASTQPVTQPNRSSATRPIDNYLGGFFLHWLSVPFRGTPAIWGTPVLPTQSQRHADPMLPIVRATAYDVRGCKPPISILRTSKMRLITFIVAIIAVSAPAGAQGWREYEYPNEGFTVAFPVEPKVET